MQNLFGSSGFKSRHWKYKRLSLLRENYHAILRRMCETDLDWAERFEAALYCVACHWGKDARRLIAELLGRSLSHEEVSAIYKSIDIKVRTNPMQALKRSNIVNRKRAPPSARYMPWDYLPENSTSPEESLVSAFDTARGHGVDLPTYLNNPDLWEPQRRRGRPRKRS